MPTREVFRARPFRLALAFALAISAATFAAFGFIYLKVSSDDVQRIGAVLVDEAARSDADSEARLRRALELRLTRDIRRLDYVGLFDASGARIFGDVDALPPIPIDGRAHMLQHQLLPDSSRAEPALLVARRRPDETIVVFGRSLREVSDIQDMVLRALAIALLPTVLVILAIGAVFARRASRRFDRIHGAILRIMNGELQSRLPVERENDDLEKVALAVNRMLDEIERLLDQLKSVGDSIAHDLRTPLMVARLKLTRALEDEADVGGLRATMTDALSQIDRASVTISAILRVSAVENDARRSRFADFDLAALCADVAEFFQPLADAKGVGLFLDAPSAAPMRGDEDLMREAISNLVDNAIKFTPEGGQVRIEATLVDGAPHLAVSDTGQGVPPEERERIFHRFHRGAGADGAAGHGLGLSIARTIAGLHGLHLTVEDNDPGARFVLSRVETAAPEPARAAERRTDAARTSSKRLSKYYLVV